MDENRSSSISKTDSEEAIGEFWDNHDFTDFDSDAPDAEFEVISTVPVPTQIAERDIAPLMKRGSSPTVEK